jgi:hypothetical protein
MNKQNNIFFSAIFLIVLLAYPVLSKILHQHHTDQSVVIDPKGDVNYNSHHEHCFTCEFEFVSFDSESLPEISYKQPDFVVISESVSYFHDCFKPLFYSLRAPPVV